MPRAASVIATVGILTLVAASCSDDDPSSDGAAAATVPAATDADVDDPPATDPAPSTSDAATAGDGAPTSDDPGADDEDAVDDGDDVAISVEASPYSPIAAAVEVSAPDPVTVEVTATSGDDVVEVPPFASESAGLVVPVVGLRASSTYDLEIVVSDASGETLATSTERFTTSALPDDVPDFEVEVDPDRAQPGVTVIELGPNYAEGEEPDPPLGDPVVAIDDEGEVVWFYRNTGNVGGVEPTVDGTFITHYFPVGAREIDVLGNVLGNWRVDPEPQAVDAELRGADALSAVETILSGNPGDPEAIPVVADWVDLTSFHHEIDKMPDGNYLGLSTTNHQVPPELRAQLCPGDEAEFEATSDVIVEFEPDGTVVRTWDLWDAIDVEAVPGSSMCATDVTGGLFESTRFRDWTHANAVIYDEDRDAIIVSVRHTDQVIALDHLDDTGPQSSVRWVLGAGPDALPLDGETPYHQHAVELQDDGSILLYDNGNGRPGTEVGDPDSPTYSRAVLYAIDDSAEDPAQWSATQLWEHRMDDIDGTVLYARFLGDADRVDNGNVLIDHGGIDNEGSFPHTVIVEVVPDGDSGGDIVWSTTIGDETLGYTSYRAERLPSLYFGANAGG